MMEEARGLLLTAPFELQRVRKLASADQARDLQSRAARTVFPQWDAPVSALEMARQRQRLSLGDYGLDGFLGGGLLTRGLIEISGESATGKTQLCIQLCLSVQLPVEFGGLGGAAVYVSTEGAFATRRLQQIQAAFQQRYDFLNMDMMDAVYVEHALTLDDLDVLLQLRLPKLLADSNVRLVVIDSLAALFRSEFDPSQFPERSRILSKTASVLKRLSDEFDTPIVCVNQVTDQFSSDDSSPATILPTLGLLWSNCVNMRLLLTRRELPSTGATSRQMHVVFAPHLPSNALDFVITADGVACVPPSS